jgi:hypothetical protein
MKHGVDSFGKRSGWGAWGCLGFWVSDENRWILENVY